MVLLLNELELGEARERPQPVDLLIGESALPMLEGFGREHTYELPPKLVAAMAPEQFAQMMCQSWPGMLENCFAAMDLGQREKMLDHCRGVLDAMEEKFAPEPFLIAGPS